MKCDLLQGCSTFCCDPIRTLVNTEVMAPFIEITVAGGGNKITVGNNSMPSHRNHACVKAFKFGHNTGLEIEVEITDEAGGNFAIFIDHIVSVQNPDIIQNNDWMSAKWGWIESSCDGNSRTMKSALHTLNLREIETSYQNGLMKYILKGTDSSQDAFESSVEEVFGTDDAPLPLKKAIKAICDRYNCDVYFRRAHTDDEWNFGTGGLNDGKGDPDYPKQSWKSHSENFIQAIMRWITGYTTDRGKGITPSFNSERPPGSRNEFILWEGFDPKCGERRGCEDSIGTYIVNGGKNSPVISFQPNVKWTFAGLNRSSGASSTTNNENLAEVGDPNCDTGEGDENAPSQGNRTYNIVSDDAINVYGTKLALKEIMKAQVQHTKANTVRHTIDAELKIQGDPTMASPINMIDKKCAIVVINPYHIQAFGGNECGDWLQAETCNSVLSNRRWTILGSSHEIKEGSYTTTLKIQLAAPGSDNALGQPLGGDTDGHVIPQK